MATIQTFICRFQPKLRQRRPGPMTKYLVPVSWWAYDDDRLDARGPAKRVEALVSVKAYDPKEARKLVVKEWGNYGSVGTAAVSTTTKQAVQTDES
jgi:hypothetical protein